MITASTALIHLAAVTCVTTPNPERDRIESLVHRDARGFDHESREAIANTIDSASRAAGLPADLVMGVIYVESTFIRAQRSQVGALGLMQVMPSTGESVADDLDIPWNGRSTLFDTTANVRIGTHYLAWLLRRFDDNLDHALTAYCHGPARVRKILRRDGKLDADMLNYARKVKRARYRYVPVRSVLVS